jgi:hypothetical protein
VIASWKEQRGGVLCLDSNKPAENKALMSRLYSTVSYQIRANGSLLQVSKEESKETGQEGCFIRQSSSCLDQAQKVIQSMEPCIS